LSSAGRRRHPAVGAVTRGRCATAASRRAADEARTRDPQHRGRGDVRHVPRAAERRRAGADRPTARRDPPAHCAGAHQVADPRPRCSLRWRASSATAQECASPRPPSTSPRERRSGAVDVLVPVIERRERRPRSRQACVVSKTRATGLRPSRESRSLPSGPGNRRPRCDALAEFGEPSSCDLRASRAPPRRDRRRRERAAVWLPSIGPGSSRRSPSSRSSWAQRCTGPSRQRWRPVRRANHARRDDGSPRGPRRSRRSTSA
jgi:hypothetical protein